MPVAGVEVAQNDQGRYKGSYNNAGSKYSQNTSPFLLLLHAPSPLKRLLMQLSAALLDGPGKQLLLGTCAPSAACSVPGPFFPVAPYIPGDIFDPRLVG